MVERVRGLPQQDAAETLEIMGIDWSAVSTEESGRPDDDKLLGWCQPDSDHVFLNNMAKSNSRIEPFLDDVDQPILAYEVQLDVGVQIQEVRQ